MKALVLNERPMSWFSPFIGLDVFEPVVSSFEPVYEDISETPQTYMFKYKMPGFRKKDLQLSIKNNVLILEGQSKLKTGTFKKSKEEYSSTFERRIVLTEDMNTDRIRAKFNKGILHIEIPKKAEYLKYREIQVFGTSTSEKKEIEEAKINQGLFSVVKNKFQKVFKRAA